MLWVPLGRLGVLIPSPETLDLPMVRLQAGHSYHVPTCIHTRYLGMYIMYLLMHLHTPIGFPVTACSASDTAAS
jgi:hypothetical protein